MQSTDPPLARRQFLARARNSTLLASSTEEERTCVILYRPATEVAASMTRYQAWSCPSDWQCGRPIGQLVQTPTELRGAVLGPAARSIGADVAAHAARGPHVEVLRAYHPQDCDPVNVDGGAKERASNTASTKPTWSSKVPQQGACIRETAASTTRCPKMTDLLNLSTQVAHFFPPAAEWLL